MRRTECKKSSGFTLVELLIYVAVFLLLIAASLPFILDMGAVRTKHFTQADIQSQMRFVTEKIKYEIRNSSQYNGTSTFNTDIADTPAADFFSINKWDVSPPPNGTYYDILFDVSGGALRMKRGTGNWINLTSAPVTVTDLVFINNSAGASQNITFTVTMVANQNSAKSQFRETLTTTTSASIRSRP